MIITFILHNKMQNYCPIATFRSPTANFIRHVATWRCWLTRDQNAVIGKSCHRLVRCQNPRQRKSSENMTTQRIYPHTQGGQLHQHIWGSLRKNEWKCEDFKCVWKPTESRLCLTHYNLLMTVFWSRVYQQRHVTTCLMMFAVGERNVAIRCRFCVRLCNMNVISYS